MISKHVMIDTDWLEAHLYDPKLRLLDATVIMKQDENGVDISSGKEEYDKEHIPGAVFADLMHELSDTKAPLPFTAPSHEEFAQTISDLGVGEGTYVVVYDRGAVVGATFTASDWASRLWWQLRLEGFDEVYVLAGGLPKWKEEGRPLTDEPGSYPKATFTGQRRPELLASKEDMKNAMHDTSTVIVNCLSPAEFKGETNAYPRNGHIPNSKNVFFGDVTDPETKGVPDKEKLHELFDPVGALDNSNKVITYCGGGIAATWNALALFTLGREDVAIYDGSMVEWSSDESLPLEVGE
ncbi:thiosulfate/3-mercaptopyruvate sulfurtransferase [Gracilibacillus ureilyticus]|uniref:Thiosulfate/3-mercaptopyruvate sulfurtransferase n=1 Tax=Gracilibacillus ureilyticus TaxID=531814 RepID=A0A1H9VZ09_9BACI|nr:sulfurtransferase [Gracilibacillus ureilyticus]SES26784.1 thiosulfate/3-mercaptopyruvate sulfurtransferase [Gracilibacillus ureilyticus]